jgi:hypothetical protein
MGFLLTASTASRKELIGDLTGKTGIFRADRALLATNGLKFFFCSGDNQPLGEDSPDSTGTSRDFP